MDFSIRLITLLAASTQVGIFPENTVKVLLFTLLTKVGLVSVISS
ncbi:uncharacterized protein METZ01_LOCUS375030, partial [marine metagenome]